MGGEGWRSALPASCLSGCPWEPCYPAQLSPNTALALSLPHIPQLPDSSNFIFRQNGISALTWHSQKRHCSPRLPWFSIWLNHWGIKTTWVMSKPVEEHTNDTSVTLIDTVGSKCLGPLYCYYINIYIYIYIYIIIFIIIYLIIYCVFPSIQCGLYDHLQVRKINPKDTELLYFSPRWHKLWWWNLQSTKK